MDFEAARLNMVESQIRPNEVTDPLIIEAMSQMPREAFVPERLAGVAYVDEALAVGNGRYLMEPMVLARLLQAAEIQAEDLALVIGCGSGYSAAVLARLAGTVVAIEATAELVDQASETLASLGIDNAAVIEAPLTDGYPKQAPYDVILFGGAVSEVPRHLTDQLADGGRLVAVAAKSTGLGHGVLVTRHGASVVEREIFDAGTPLLPGFEPVPTFRL